MDLTPLAVFPARNFNYLTELASLRDSEPASDEELLDEISSFFRGAQRPESAYCLFNLNVLPTVEATAAACLAVMHNVNGLMDDFAGESLLIEQKVARTVGRWAGWPDSMGISCSGGKATITYAVRTALIRAQPRAAKTGLRSNTVIICSAAAHYSVEHVAAMVGLGMNNVVRIPTETDGGMSPSALHRALEEAHSSGLIVAAVICCGGTVIDFHVDSTEMVYRVVEDFVHRHHLEMRPYLHLDSVIGWLYLAWRDLSPTALQELVPDDTIRARIADVLDRIAMLDKFDSLGIDFHKTGLCPYSSSFFVAADRSFMNHLGTGDYEYSDDDFQFGNFRTYRYTLENSRSTAGTLSAWINIRRLGKTGICNYLVDLHRARQGVEAAVIRHGQFKLLNQRNLGWEVVFHIPFQGAHNAATYEESAIAFIEHYWRRVREGRRLPLINIVPNFRAHEGDSTPRPAFVIYPMVEQEPAFWDTVLSELLAEHERFEGLTALVPQQSGVWQHPIR